MKHSLNFIKNSTTVINCPITYTCMKINASLQAGYFVNHPVKIPDVSEEKFISNISFSHEGNDLPEKVNFEPDNINQNNIKPIIIDLDSYKNQVKELRYDTGKCKSLLSFKKTHALNTYMSNLNKNIKKPGQNIDFYV